MSTSVLHFWLKVSILKLFIRFMPHYSPIVLAIAGKQIKLTFFTKITSSTSFYPFLSTLRQSVIPYALLFPSFFPTVALSLQYIRQPILEPSIKGLPLFSLEFPVPSVFWSGLFALLERSI